MYYSTIKDCVQATMEMEIDLAESHAPLNPAIIADRNGRGYYYGSGLTAAETGDTIVADLADGWGSWTPETAEDIPDCALAFAAEIADEVQATGGDADRDLVAIVVSGHGGRDAGMCGDGEIVCADGTPYRVVGDHPDGWHVTSDPMARRVLAKELDWDDVGDDECADDIRATVEAAR